jgi:hypothetical protein
MKRPALLASIASAALVVASTVGLIIAGSAAQASPASTTTNMYVTFYGWYDNSPPGAGIAYPGLHSSAGGTGTFADPITFATDKSELKAGTKVYYATVKKYFVMEDDCTECDEDWTGHGPDGGPKFWHVDLWTGGKGGNEKAAIDCEDALTQSNPDGSPKQTPVLVNPPSNEPVDSTPLFNAQTGACYGGATSPTTFGQYKNSSSGLCMNDPNGSTKSGTLLTVAACNGSTTQKFRLRRRVPDDQQPVRRRGRWEHVQWHEDKHRDVLRCPAPAVGDQRQPHDRGHPVQQVHPGVRHIAGPGELHGVQ